MDSQDIYYMMWFDDTSGRHVVTKATDEILETPLRPFDYVTLKLNGVYDDFYELGEAGTTGFTMYRVLSKNHEKLKGFCGWINRITT